MGKRRAKKSRRKMELATAMLVFLAAAINFLVLILERLLK